jgi:hypothetical protein
LCSNARCEAIGSAEDDWAWLNATGHIMRLCGGVDDLIDGLHCEVKGHEPKIMSASVLFVESSQIPTRTQGEDLPVQHRQPNRRSQTQ